ncbi:MAG TPA: oxidoreductase [Gemmatimonadaceae bacterium]|nr:oxidoreductase [Gemmatimonadaceae bacterium]
MSTKPVWFITGCSTGFGRELARILLEREYRVVVTARDPATVADLVAGRETQALVQRLDVTDRAQITAAVAAAEAHFGGIDVLVNNAGIGYFGAVEESEEAEVRRMFEINVFGLAWMTQAVLPIMRRQRSGRIMNVASIAGIRGNPGIGFYNASKFAVVGLSEALAREVEPLGIKVTVIAPSGFRTDWAGRSANEAPHRLPEYAPTAGKNIRIIREASGKQPGDPVRAAEAIIHVAEIDDPPMTLLLGQGALRGARRKLEELEADIDAWEATTAGADVPPTA